MPLLQQRADVTIIKELNLKSPMLHPALHQLFQELESEFYRIPAERKRVLENVSAFMGQKLSNETSVSLNFICTHNSRRSHLAQLWTRAAAYFYGLPEVYTFSGGTEATAFHPNAVSALRRAGFQIEKKKEGTNPLYEVSYAADAAPVQAFSKVFDAPENPRDNFGAIMTCSDAEENCPFIPGAALRLAIPYEDPKVADNSPAEEAVYRERCRQIGVEMAYACSLVK